MDRLEWDASFRNNAVIVISAVRENEAGVARRLLDDLAVFKASHHEFILDHVRLKSRQHMVEVMHSLARHARKGLRPIVHLDMHGDARRGLEIAPSREYASWQEVFAWLRKINVKARGNLGVAGAACYSLSLIRSISILQPVPFYFLVAPQTEFKLGQADERMATFYRELMAGDGLGAAVASLGPPFELFHCEKMLTIVLARYIKHQCKGRGGSVRRERLITEALERGLPRTKGNLQLLRKNVREHLEPSETLIRRYADRFLLGREYHVTLQMLLELIG